MTTTYKIKASSIELAEPHQFTYAFSDAGKVTRVDGDTTKTYPTATIDTDQFFFEQLDSNNTQTKKEYGLTKTIYHSQTLFNMASTGYVYPIWQSDKLTTTKTIDIGRVTLHVTFLTNVTNINNPNLLRLVATNQDDSNLTTNNIFSELSSYNTGGDAILFTHTGLKLTQFYIKGRNITTSPETFTYTIDLNIPLKGDTGDYISLGLETDDSSFTQTNVKVETYVELLSK